MKRSRPCPRSSTDARFSGIRDCFGPPARSGPGVSGPAAAAPLTSTLLRVHAVVNALGASAPGPVRLTPAFPTDPGGAMAKASRKRKSRKKKAANHGKRPNS
ncbi:50S ribosomal protein bL37 [Glycomyces sp. NRRL B-16210]|uniref:50S ribosomal protein bL37 n=1 Tax=Glycomyces sp. NRRL B-16210 TaxID=1463821 RepID=UPI00350F0D53